MIKSTLEYKYIYIYIYIIIMSIESLKAHWYSLLSFIIKNQGCHIRTSLDFGRVYNTFYLSSDKNYLYSD